MTLCQEMRLMLWRLNFKMYWSRIDVWFRFSWVVDVWAVKGDEVGQWRHNYHWHSVTQSHMVSAPLSLPMFNAVQPCCHSISSPKPFKLTSFDPPPVWIMTPSNPWEHRAQRNSSIMLAWPAQECAKNWQYCAGGHERLCSVVCMNESSGHHEEQWRERSVLLHWSGQISREK